MTTVQKLHFASAVIAAIETHLIDATTGTFKHQPDYADDLAFAADVEAAYKANGGAVSADVDKALAGAAALVKILGL